MKKLLLVTLSTILIACSTKNNPIDPYPNISSIQELPKEYRYLTKQCSADFPQNGELDQVVSNGRRIKAKIKNYCIDEEVFIFHPNGQLHSNTPLIQGIPNGWSYGYTVQGILRTKILYQEGKIIVIQIYDSNGNLEREIK